jgi:predicted RNA-binding protein with PIN domain
VTPELDLLRPALEMAMIVARQGETAPVRVEAPRPLRPFLRFAKLPPRALAAARVALEDGEFRARVAERCDEEEVGRAGWLLLTRPEHWDEELDALVQDRVAAAEASEEGTARRGLLRAAETIRSQQREIDAQARELRRLHQQLEARAVVDDRHRDALAQAQEVTDAALAERARAVRELKDMERRLGERTAELRRLAEHAGDASPEPEVPDDPRWAEAERLLAELRVGWLHLGSTLDALEALTGGDERGGGSSGGNGRGGRHRPARPRRPVGLGQGLVEGTPAAARWLLARPGAVALVDGYNVTMLAWPDLSVTDQRLALERAAAQLQVQLGAQMVLVFDGDSDGGTAVRAAVGSPVRVRFTHHDVEADDEILDMIEAVSAPVVVVVSNDRRVLDGARERGANVVRSTDFVALVR